MKSNSANGPSYFMQVLTQFYAELGLVQKPEQLLKRLDFMFHEFITKEPVQLAIEEKLEKLRHFFYFEKRFGLEQIENHIDKSKEITEFFVTALYKHLANRVNIPLEFVVLPNSLLLRLVNAKQTFFISAKDQGSVLTLEQMIARLSKGATLDAQDEMDVLFEHLEFLKKSPVFLQEENLLKILNLQLEIKPHFTPALAQRATLLSLQQKNEDAIHDFRRYFSFIEETLAPPELLLTYKKVQARLEVKPCAQELYN